MARPVAPVMKPWLFSKALSKRSHCPTAVATRLGQRFSPRRDKVKFKINDLFTALTFDYKAHAFVINSNSPLFI
jgi:hypothetical protein